MLGIIMGKLAFLTDPNTVRRTKAENERLG
ncbi:MAG: hypothetical protein QOF73_4544 [Thermomicrobiales bacterium]|jgi:hypothetical protein|nr:hypothetical protein [Thermomicrobiales bacterium]